MELSKFNEDGNGCESCVGGSGFCLEWMETITTDEFYGDTSKCYMNVDDHNKICRMRREFYDRISNR